LFIYCKVILKGFTPTKPFSETHMPGTMPDMTLCWAHQFSCQHWLLWCLVCHDEGNWKSHRTE